MLALISNYPSDKRPLSEYGFYLKEGLNRYNTVKVLSGKANSPSNGEIRIWDHGSPMLPFQAIKALEKLNPQFVMLNTSYTCWGSNAANFGALMLPWFLRNRRKVITLVHDLPHLIDISKTGYKFTLFHKIAIEMATRSLATSTAVCFTLPRNSSFFSGKYPFAKVAHIPHGILGDSKWCNLTSNGVVLTFGKFGRAKNPEPLIKVFNDGHINGKLIVAGPSAATSPGFVEDLALTYSSDRIVFTGYVPEEDVSNLFHGADLVVLPYEENVGASGVLMQCCQFGRAVLLKKLPIFEQTANELGLCVHFYESDAELSSLVPLLLSDKRKLEEEGRVNYEAVQHLNMECIALKYWQLLEEI